MNFRYLQQIRFYVKNLLNFALIHSFTLIYLGLQLSFNIFKHETKRQNYSTN